MLPLHSEKSKREKRNFNFMTYFIKPKNSIIMTLQKFSIGMRQTITILSLFFLSAFALQAQTPDFQQKKDSLLGVINTAKGEAKLAAYLSLVTLNCPPEETDNMLTLIDDYIDECRRQQNVNAETSARTTAVSIMFNYGKTDYQQKRVEEHLAFFRDNNFLTSYYRVKRFLLERAFQSGEREQSLNGAMALYEEAKADNFPFGIASANYFMGLYYINLADTKNGEKYMREAMDAAKKCEETDCRVLLIETYFRLCEFYTNYYEISGGEKTDLIPQIKTLLAEWRKEIAKLQTQSSIALFADYFAVQIKFNIAINNLAVAENYCDSIESATPDPFSMASVLHYKSNIATMRKDYALALDYNNRAYEAVMTYGDLSHSLYLLVEKIGIISQMKNAPEIIDIVNTFRERLESLHNEESTMQLNELRTKYDVDMLEVKNEEQKQQLIFAFLALALLLVIVVIILINRHKIHSKNVALVRQILEQENRQKNLTGFESPTTGLKEEADDLFDNLERLMQTDKPYINYECNRKTIADTLHTNEEYLRQTIKRCAGVSIGDYIALYRLQNAKNLLLNDKENYTIESVAFDSGFGSRDAFYDSFRKHYGLTPTEFRKIAKENM